MDTPTPVAGSSPTTENTPAVAPAAQTPVAPAQSAPPAPAAAPEAPKPTAADVLGALNAEERRQYVSGKKFSEIVAARPASKNVVPATPAAPAPSRPAPPAAADPSAPPAAPAAPDDVVPAPEDAPDEAPDRFRFKNAEDKAIAFLAKTKGISIREATKLFEGPTAAPSAPAAPETPAAPTIDAELADYDAQIAKLDERVKKLTTDRLRAREDMDTDKGDALSDEIAEARTNAVLLKNERQGFVRNREHTAAQNAQQQIISSRDRAIAQYPDLQVEGSMPQLALREYVNGALADSARAAEFKDPSWPEKITHEFAQKHGLKKAGNVASTPAPAPAPTPASTPQPQALLRSQPKQVPGARLVTSADGSQPSAPVPLTAAQVQADFSRMTPAQRHAILFPVKRA